MLASVCWKGKEFLNLCLSVGCMLECPGKTCDGDSTYSPAICNRCLDERARPQKHLLFSPVWTLPSPKSNQITASVSNLLFTHKDTTASGKASLDTSVAENMFWIKQGITCNFSWRKINLQEINVVPLLRHRFSIFNFPTLFPFLPTRCFEENIFDQYLM